jgi:hypothetical protein
VIATHVKSGTSSFVVVSANAWMLADVESTRGGRAGGESLAARRRCASVTAALHMSIHPALPLSTSTRLIHRLLLRTTRSSPVPLESIESVMRRILNCIIPYLHTRDAFPCMMVGMHVVLRTDEDVDWGAPERRVYAAEWVSGRGRSPLDDAPSGGGRISREENEQREEEERREKNEREVACRDNGAK